MFFFILSELPFPAGFFRLFCRFFPPVSTFTLFLGPSGYKKPPMEIHRRSVLALPIFPCSHPQSIVGANELNFCVRDGNRWTLIAINTNYMDKSFRFHRLVRSVSRPVCQSALRSNSSSILARYLRSVKHFSHPCATQRSGCQRKGEAAE